MNLKLAALLGALTLITPAIAMADPPQQWQGPYGTYGYQNNQGDDRDDNGKHHDKSCVNPAGHQRGWCKNSNCNYQYNGQYPYPNNGQYPNQYNNGQCYSNNGGYYGNNGYGQNGYGQNASIRGVITGVNGSTVTIVQGLSPISFDASQAFRNGRVNGGLYPSRSITAQGYYDNNGYFHAVTIS